jgi:hypothetical protein
MTRTQVKKRAHKHNSIYESMPRCMRTVPSRPRAWILLIAIEESVVRLTFPHTRIGDAWGRVRPKKDEASPHTILYIEKWLGDLPRTGMAEGQKLHE